MKNLYLERYAWPGPRLVKEPPFNTKLIVVIPCFNEPQILATLDSLYSCETPECHVEIIIVLNHAENSPEEIKTFNHFTLNAIEEWIKVHTKESISFLLIKAFDLPKKISGVGLARKIGMDEAVRRFEKLHDKKGVIVCIDADCRCDANYLLEIYQFYKAHPEANVALVHFEHPLKGELNPDIYEGITNYELHLRYYKNALEFAQFPFSYHTIGSCITVTSDAYQKQNGMNKRKAGEDFYFLQKLFPLGNIYNINTTTVYPSPRASDRVPFGTGKAINNYLQNKDQDYFTYNPKTFYDLKTFLGKLKYIYEQKKIESALNELPLSIKRFLPTIDFINNVLKIKENSSSFYHFTKAFYQWFNGFAVLKYVHFARDNFYEDINILEAVNLILSDKSEGNIHVNDKRNALELLRAIDKSQ